MELGVSSNNNLILPLVNAIAENDLENSQELIAIIYDTIIKFNFFVKGFPQYRKYLLNHTEMNEGMQQTYLKIYKSCNVFTMEEYFDQMFIKEPPLMFFIHFYKIILENSSRNHQPSHHGTPCTSSKQIDNFSSHAYNNWDINHTESICNTEQTPVSNMDPFQSQVIQSRDMMKIIVRYLEKDPASSLSQNLIFLGSLLLNPSEDYSFVKTILIEALSFYSRSRYSKEIILEFFDFLTEEIKSLPRMEASKDPSADDDNKINEMKRLLNIVELFSDKIIQRFEDKCLQVCNYALNRIMNQTKSNTKSGEGNSTKYVEELKLEDDELNSPLKNIQPRKSPRAPSSPLSINNSPYNGIKPNRVSKRYRTLSNLSGNKHSAKRKKSARGALISKILINLNNLKVQIKSNENEYQPEALKIDIINILRMMKVKFRYNFTLNLSIERVVEIAMQLQREEYLEYFKLIFFISEDSVKRIILTSFEIASEELKDTNIKKFIDNTLRKNKSLMHLKNVAPIDYEIEVSDLDYETSPKKTEQKVEVNSKMVEHDTNMTMQPIIPLSRHTSQQLVNRGIDNIKELSIGSPDKLGTPMGLDMKRVVSSSEESWEVTDQHKNIVTMIKEIPSRFFNANQKLKPVLRSDMDFELRPTPRAAVRNSEGDVERLYLPPLPKREMQNRYRDHISDQWNIEFMQSIYFVDKEEECISRWMQRMMKDKTSFWFDQIMYDTIRNDYKEVRKDFNHYIQEKSLKIKNRKNTEIIEAPGLEVNIQEVRTSRLSSGNKVLDQNEENKENDIDIGSDIKIIKNKQRKESEEIYQDLLSEMGSITRKMTTNPPNQRIIIPTQ